MFLVLFVCLFSFMGLDVLAVPAYPYPIQVSQPDGTKLTIQLHGDEYFNYVTTEDGYLIIKNQQDYYVYATVSQAGQLTPTSRVARDANVRNAADVSFLKSIDKRNEIS